jgi:Uma2 family endonuclease
MPIVSTTKMNAQQFLQLGEDPPGVRLELVDGEVAVSPSPTPRHSFAIIKLARILDTYITDNDLGELYQDVDTLLTEYNVRRPDLLYFSKARTHLVGEKAMEGPPDLAIEVISPSSIEVDRDDKFKQYRDAGVMNYWIIDPAQRTVEAWVLAHGEYISAGGGAGSGGVRLPPFPELEIRIEQLWKKWSREGASAGRSPFTDRQIVIARPLDSRRLTVAGTGGR